MTGTSSGLTENSMGAMDSARWCRRGASSLILAFVAVHALGMAVTPRPALAQTQSAGTPASGSTQVDGVVYDSIAGRPRSGARVELVTADNTAGGRIYSAVSDSAGRFTIRDVPHGRYIAGFFDVTLDTLGFESVPRLMTLASPTQRVDLATPSMRTLIGVVCATRAADDSSGLLVGHVRSTEARAPITGAGVVVEWRDLELDGTGLHHRDRSVSARTGASGWFAVCGIPADATLQVRAGQGADSSGYVEVEIPAASLRHVGFQVGGATRIEVPTGAAVPGAKGETPVTWRGRGRLSGVVRDARGQPFAGAHALVWGTGLTATTNEAGAFTLEGLPGGTQTLDVSGIGHVPTRAIVDLAEARPATVDVQLERMPTMLEAVTIRERAISSRQLVEFERRRRAGIGTFVTPAMLEKNRHRRLSDVLRGVPGVMIEDAGGHTQVRMRGSGTLVDPLFCTPSLYLDRAHDAMPDWDQIRVDEIVAIEVYSRPSSRPFEFIDQTNACGAVVVWTRIRGNPGR